MSGTTMSAAIDKAIDAVHDPCSIAANAPLGVRDMGLVRRRDVDPDGNVHVVLSPTFPSCIMLGCIAENIEREVSAIPGVASVRVEVDGEFVWSPDEMSDHGRAWLDERRGSSRRLLPVRPREWVSKHAS